MTGVTFGRKFDLFRDIVMIEAESSCFVGPANHAG